MSMLTPVVAMGVLWITALCEESSTEALIDFFSLIWRCVMTGECPSEDTHHCIAKYNNTH